MVPAEGSGTAKQQEKHMIKFGKETKETYCRFDVEMEKKDWDTLRNYAMEHILSDDDELVNYAFNRILREQLEKGREAGTTAGKRARKSK